MAIDPIAAVSPNQVAPVILPAATQPGVVRTTEPLPLLVTPVNEDGQGGAVSRLVEEIDATSAARVEADPTRLRVPGPFDDVFNLSSLGFAASRAADEIGAAAQPAAAGRATTSAPSAAEQAAAAAPAAAAVAAQQAAGAAATAAVGPTQVADSTEALIRAGVTAAALRTGALDPAVVAAQGGSGAQVALAARAQSGLPLSEGGEPFVFDATVDPLLFGVGAATPTPQEVAEAGGTGEQIAAAARAQAQAQADSVDEDTAIAGRSGLTPQEVAASGGTAAQIAAAALAEAGLPAAGATTATGTATLGATPAAVLDNLADQAATARVEDRTAAEQLAQAQAQAAADAEQQLEDELLLDAAFTSQTLRNAFQAQQLDGLLARREIESALGGLSGLAANAQAEDVSRAAPDAPLSALSELAARSTALPDGEQMLADELLTAALPEPAQPQPQATTPTTTTVAAAAQPDPRQALEQRLIHDTLTPGLGNTQPYMVYGAPTNPAMNPVRDTYVPPDNVVNPVAASAATDEVMTGPLDTAGLVRAVAPRR